MPACIWKPKAQNVGHKDLLSQKDAAKKKLFFKGQSSKRYCKLLFSGQWKGNYHFEICGPSCYKQNSCRTWDDASCAWNRLQEIIRTVLDGNFPAFVKQFASLCRCFAILAACNMAKQKLCRVHQQTGRRSNSKLLNTYIYVSAGCRTLFLSAFWFLSGWVSASCRLLGSCQAVEPYFFQAIVTLFLVSVRLSQLHFCQGHVTLLFGSKFWPNFGFC